MIVINVEVFVEKSLNRNTSCTPEKTHKDK